MHQYNVGAPFERIAIDVAGPFLRSDHGNRYLLIAVDYFTKWLEVYANPNREALTVAEALVANTTSTIMTRQHLKLASDWMKTRYDKLANSASYQEGDRVWLYRPTRMKGKLPKLPSSWEGPYQVVTRINDVVYRIQKNSRSRMMVVHLDRLASYQGAARDERT
jgi:hypothetical protein